MKLLEELYCFSDTTGKPIKFKFIGSYHKINNRYEIYDDQLIGIVNKIDPSTTCCELRSKNVSFSFLIQSFCMFISRIVSDNPSEMKRFKLKNITDDQLINIIRGDFTEWDDLIYFLDLEEDKIESECMDKINLVNNLISTFFGFTILANDGTISVMKNS